MESNTDIPPVRRHTEFTKEIEIKENRVLNTFLSDRPKDNGKKNIEYDQNKIENFFYSKKSQQKEKINKYFFTRIDSIPSERLENRDTQIRIGRFITETFQRESPVRTAAVAPSTEPDKRKFRSPTGLVTEIRDISELELAGFQLQKPIKVKGQPVSFPEQKYTKIDFTPGRRLNFIPSRVTDSLAKGILGLGQLISAIQEGKVEVAPVFVGWTNINMALISQRLGFEIADSCRKADGTIDTSRRVFVVIGRLEVIKEKVKEFQASGRAARIAARNQRLEGAPA